MKSILEEIRYALHSTGWENFAVEGERVVDGKVVCDLFDKDGNEFKLSVEIKPA